MKIAKKASSSVEAGPASSTIEAREATMHVQYKTCGSPPIRVAFKGFTSDGMCLVEAYDPTVPEWRSVKVPKDYKLRTLKEGEEMPLATTAKKASGKNSVKAAGAVSGKTVYQVWGAAFKEHAAKPNAPALIVSAMAKEFPGRKTNWAKWVNSVRTLYNRGDARMGVAKPAAPIKPYGSKPKVVPVAKAK